MKSVLKRRKHRKGIRPVRKGTLKVRMIEFPEYLNQLFYSSAILDKAIELLGRLLENPSGKNRKETEAAYGFRKAEYDKAKKGDDFLKSFKQIKPVSLTLDVINYVDPIYPISETMDEKCARCPNNANCAFKCYENLEHRFRWCPVGTGTKVLAPIAKDLTTSEMAKLALTHLS